MLSNVVKIYNEDVTTTSYHTDVLMAKQGDMSFYLCGSTRLMTIACLALSPDDASLTTLVAVSVSTHIQ